MQYNGVRMTMKFTKADVRHIASLAAIPVTEKEEQELADGFTKTISVVEQFQKVNISQTTEEHITGQSNIFREDEVDEPRMFTQEQALANASRTHNGYFVVDQVLEQEE
jgi:aspartyl/glutamyl-tRNA(Asn/Gln) amidotransferase C subunit